MIAGRAVGLTRDHLVTKHWADSSHVARSNPNSFVICVRPPASGAASPLALPRPERGFGRTRKTCLRPSCTMQGIGFTHALKHLSRSISTTPKLLPLPSVRFHVLV